MLVWLCAISFACISLPILLCRGVFEKNPRIKETLDCFWTKGWMCDQLLCSAGEVLEKTQS